MFMNNGNSDVLTAHNEFSKSYDRLKNFMESIREFKEKGHEISPKINNTILFYIKQMLNAATELAKYELSDSMADYINTLVLYYRDKIQLLESQTSVN